MDSARPLRVGHYGLCFTRHIALACMAIKDIGGSRPNRSQIGGFHSTFVYDLLI